MGLFNIGGQKPSKPKTKKTKKKKKHDYSASDIKVLKGLEGVRKRPSMYIGDVGKRGLHHLVYELVDNAVDEALAGFCTDIKVIIHKDRSVTVSDNGRGIPVDKHPETDLPAVEMVMTTLHAGGKFDNKSYAVSGGLHGVGASVVNALSEWCEVRVKRDGKIWYQRYERGTTKTKLKAIGDSKATGTEVKFKPDNTIFNTTKFEYAILKDRLSEIVHLVPDLTITIKDERTGNKSKLQSGGLIDFLNEITTNKALTPPISIYKTDSKLNIAIVMGYYDTYNEEIHSFVNTINTREGGFHVTGFRSGISRAFTKYIKDNKIDTKVEISSDDFREGLVAIMHILMPDPRFEGQTKTKLGNNEVRAVIETVVREGLYRWLSNNPDIASKIIAKAIISAKSKKAAKQARELVRRKSSLENTVLPGKLADCTSRKPSESELFICEGDSAGGTMKGARDRYTQAVLPLRGKILNVQKATAIKSFENNEIKAIITAIGAGIGEKCNPAAARYQKIIIATDSDIDGQHITTLLLTLFYKYMRPLIEAGYIYIAQPPLYMVKIGNKTKYVLTKAELDKILKHNSKLKRPKKIHIQRFKGLGEMNVDQLHETVMDKEQRVLKQVKLDDAEMADRLIKILMGNSAEKRREFIVEHSNEIDLERIEI